MAVYLPDHLTNCPTAQLPACLPACLPARLQKLHSHAILFLLLRSHTYVKASVESSWDGQSKALSFGKRNTLYAAWRSACTTTSTEGTQLCVDNLKSIFNVHYDGTTEKQASTISRPSSAS